MWVSQLNIDILFTYLFIYFLHFFTYFVHIACHCIDDIVIYTTLWLRYMYEKINSWVLENGLYFMVEALYSEVV